MKIIMFTSDPAIDTVLKNLATKDNLPAYIVPPNKTHMFRDEIIKISHKYNIPVVMFDDSPSNETFVERINELKPDLILVFIYPFLIPKSVYTVAKIAAINIHPSLLPNYRGGSPVYHVINNGESETGVSLHLLDESFDTGDLLEQTIIPILPRDSYGTLVEKITAVSAEEILNIVERIKKTGLPAHKKQNEKEVKYEAPIPTIPLKPIKWSRSSTDIDQYVRAYSPVHSAHTTLNDVEVLILSGRPVAIKDVPANHNSPGRVETIDDKGMIVGTGEGLYLITSIFYNQQWLGDPQGLADNGKIKIGDYFS